MVQPISTPQEILSRPQPARRLARLIVVAGAGLGIALLIGALEPLTYTGTMLSTGAGNHPFTRLARTAKIQETVFLGTRAEADRALAAVDRRRTYCAGGHFANPGDARNL